MDQVKETKDILENPDLSMAEEKSEAVTGAEEEKVELREEGTGQNDHKTGGTDEKKDEKKKKRPENIPLKGKSKQFVSFVELALEFEKGMSEAKELRVANKELKEEIKALNEQISENEKIIEGKKQEVENLKSDVENRNEVIDIVKADKSESEQEYKNKLAAALKTYMEDFKELKNLEMSNDVGEAMADTLEEVFKVLNKNGIIVG